jgi:hypothetical protein
MKNLTTVTPSATYPVTSSEVKLWAKIDTTADDSLITTLIAAATSAAEEYLKRALITQTLKLTLDSGKYTNNILGDGVYDLPISALYDGALPRVIKLPKEPIQSVTHIKTYNTSNTLSTYDSSNYYTDLSGARVVLNQTAMWGSDIRPQASCEVTYVAGYGSASDVPAPIKTAILMHIQKMYDERIVCDMPQSCKTLLDQFKIYGV